MTANECIKGRRSIRKFKQDPISHDLLAEIVETASYAPSWKHTQIVRYVAVEGELKDKIAAEGTSMFPNNGKIMQNAPMLIAVTTIRQDRLELGRSGYYTLHSLINHTSISKTMLRPQLILRSSTATVRAI